MDLYDVKEAYQQKKHDSRLLEVVRFDFFQEKSMGIQKNIHYSNALSKSSGSGSKNSEGTVNFPLAEPGFLEVTDA